MRLRAAAALTTLALAALAAGCGSSQHTPKRLTGKQRVAALRTLVAMRSRLLKKGELDGFLPSGHRAFGVDAVSWVRAVEVPPMDQSGEAERLEKLDFELGLQERLFPGKQESSTEALSAVEQFASQAGARSEVAAQVRLAKSHGRASEFTVEGIPGARGVGEPEDINVFFAAGRYYYLVGAASNPGDPHALTRGDVVAAAKRLYARASRT